jgi:capsular exopolysaccharide synthesis family protein
MALKSRSIVDFFSLDSPFANEFRRLLLKISNAAAESELKTVMLTSAMTSEGKSTICSLLGVTAAKQNGLKTLIFDCDLRRPTIHKFFAMDREPGLADILVDGYNPKEAIRKTSIDKLDILTSGSGQHQPAEVFDAEAIGYLLDELKFYYDLILVDSAPVLPVSDPLLLAKKVDGILLVVRAGATSREIVERSAEILSSARDRVLGVVLNNADNNLPYYYDYRYYGYTYKESRDKSKPSPKHSSGRRSRRRSNGGAAGSQDAGASHRNKRSIR